MIGWPCGGPNSANPIRRPDRRSTAPFVPSPRHGVHFAVSAGRSSPELEMIARRNGRGSAQPCCQMRFWMLRFGSIAARSSSASSSSVSVPAEGAGVLAGLLAVLGARDRDRALVDQPAQGDLAGRAAVRRCRCGAGRDDAVDLLHRVGGEVPLARGRVRGRVLAGEPAHPDRRVGQEHDDAEAPARLEQAGGLGPAAQQRVLDLVRGERHAVRSASAAWMRSVSFDRVVRHADRPGEALVDCTAASASASASFDRRLIGPWIW